MTRVNNFLILYLYSILFHNFYVTSWWTFLWVCLFIWLPQLHNTSSLTGWFLRIRDDNNLMRRQAASLPLLNGKPNQTSVELAPNLANVKREGITRVTDLSVSTLTGEPRDKQM